MSHPEWIVTIFAKSLSSRSRSRGTPVKSSEDLELERIEREKKELRSLKKMNEEGLRQITLSGGKREKPEGSGKTHTMFTSSDEMVRRCSNVGSLGCLPNVVVVRCSHFSIAVLFSLWRNM